MPDAEGWRLLLRFLHVVSASFLLGGLGTQAAWKVMADRTRDPRAIADVLDQLVRVDRLVTGPSAIVVFASGYAVIRVLGHWGGAIAAAPWALWGLILLFTALAAWFFGLRPLALRMADAAGAAVDAGTPLGADYGRWSATWLALWAIVIALILTVAALMVWKPGS